ncbi:DUF7662 domain-containing protein [Sphaerisporangium dianthi]|uniref:DUF7662 domain-containing protein n=1 Tax=Sphaerisporangium dianthi TaxID=1436120 RepID=A0ABV9CNA2_9ACTN
MVAREQYERLARHLQEDGRGQIDMTFIQIAQIVGDDLPPSALKHPAWWASDPKHTQAVWLDVGYVARPNLRTRLVSFVQA